MHTLLELLEQDCTQPTAQLAAQAGMTEAEVEKERARLEEDGAIWAIRQSSTGTG